METRASHTTVHGDFKTAEWDRGGERRIWETGVGRWGGGGKESDRSGLGEKKREGRRREG